MNNELKEAIEILEKEKGISKATLLDSIEQSLMQACKANFGKNDNINVTIDPETCDYRVTAEKEVVETEEDILDASLQVTVAEARKTDPEAFALSGDPFFRKSFFSFHFLQSVSVPDCVPFLF